jgi:fatty-acyl-CoA synthase
VPHARRAIVYPNDGFDPLAVLQTVQDERCTGLHGVPTMFIAELDHPRFAEFDLSTCAPASWPARPARSR